MKFVANPVEVEAYVITSVWPTRPDGSFEINTDHGWGDVQKTETITPEMAARYHPTIGDYYVVQSDGYAYINPKAVFERKYSIASAPPYTPSERLVAQIANNFAYHAPEGDQVKRYGEVRDAFRTLATFLSTQCPESRELSVAMTELETANFWANASIARNE